MNDVKMATETSTDRFKVGRDWLRAIRDSCSPKEDFLSLLMTHFGQHVVDCFELHAGRTIKSFVDLEKCERLILSPMEYFLCGEDPNTGFEKLEKLNNPPQLCGKFFRAGEPTYSCRDCGYDNTCVLCINCFQKGIHKNHHYKLNTSVGGGTCDCGDPEAWKDGYACEVHQPKGEGQEDSVPELPASVARRALCLYSAVLQYCIALLCLEKEPQSFPAEIQLSQQKLKTEDTFVTMLFNDEVHTYEEVIRTLQQAIPGCTQVEALAYANTVDREGRAPVLSGTFTDCEQARRVIKSGTSGPSRNSLKCQVMHRRLVAHQTFAVHLLEWINTVTSRSEGLRRLLCEIVSQPLEMYQGECLLDRVLLSDSSLWKAARANSQKLFMNALLMDSVGKNSFAIRFTKNYKQIQKDFIADDHDHSVSATSMSVQVYTVPTVARMLMLEHDVLRVILCAFIDELNQDQKVPGVLDFKKQDVPIRKLLYMLTDLRYLLFHTPTAWSESLRGKFDNFLDDFFGLLKMMQGMDTTTRKTGRHAEMESDWETPFNLQLRIMPILSALCEWCSSDVHVFLSSVRKAIDALKETTRRRTVGISLKRNEVCGRNLKLIEFDVTTGPVSIHQPISRFLGGLLLACDKFKLSFSDLFGFEREDDKLKLFLLEYPLRTLVMVAQVRAGMWRRNGYSVINQVYHYQNVKCRSEMFDKDVIVMQAAASFLASDYFVAAVLHRFGLIAWTRADFNENKYDQDTLNQKLTIAEEFLSLLIAIVGERYVPGVGQVTPEDATRREIIHRLFIRPQAHSELLKALPSPDLDANDKSDVDQIISSVAVFKMPGVTGRGLYQLKPELHKEYNPFFYHYTRIDQSKAEEQRNRRSKKDSTPQVHPVPVPPKFCPPFARVINVLDCRPLVDLLTTLLTRAARGRSKAVSDLMVQQVFHLICLALHEQKRHRAAHTAPAFDFIKTATKETDTHPSLLGTLQDLQSRQDLGELVPLLEWILKAFNEEQEARQETSGDLRDGSPTRMDCTSHLDEKERKARLAQERRAKIMAQMSELQKAFIKENAELLASVSTGSTTEDALPDVIQQECNDEPVVLGARRQRKELKSMPYITEPCILCQEPQEVNTDGRAVVIAAYVQRSTVLSKSRGKMFENGDELYPLYPPGDMFWGVHVSSCGHAMHSDCWQGFYDSVVAKERRAMRLRQFLSVDVSRREFLCPLCGCLANTVLPILPGPSPPEAQSAPAVTVPGFLSSMQDAVTRNVHVLANANEDKKKKPERPRDAVLPEGCQGSSPIRLKFSSSLKEMLKIFSQSTFTVGLGVQPNESDKRVCVLAWTTCFYTIQSTENARRAANKGLFAGLSSSRQSLCIGAATRVAALVSSVCNADFIKAHCLRILSVLTPHSVHGVEGPSLLELNLFGLMVQLRLSLPCLLDAAKEDRMASAAVRSLVGVDSAASMDQCVFQLVFLAQLIQILLTAPPTFQGTDPEGEEAMEQDDRRDDECARLASLWGRLRHWAGMQSSVPHESPCQLHVHVKKHVLPFLRSAALFFHFLTEIPGPTALKDDACPSMDEEYRVLCRYLGLPESLLELVQWNQDNHDISSSAISQTVRRWCSHEHVRRMLATAGVETLGYSIEPNYLLNLPHDYSELINRASLFTCPNSDGNESRAPVLCLVCGEMLCSQSFCCQITQEGGKVGACAAHAQKCGAGVGVFLRVRECQILLMANKNKGCFYPPPYLDNYGETDQGLRRGNPLYLCPARYQKLQKLWLTHCVAEEVAHCLESNRNLLSIDWTNL